MRKGTNSSLRKNTEDMSLKSGEEAQQMALQVITDSVTHSALLSLSVMEVFS